MPSRWEGMIEAVYQDIHARSQQTVATTQALLERVAHASGTAARQEHVDRITRWLDYQCQLIRPVIGEGEVSLEDHRMIEGCLNELAGMSDLLSKAAQTRNLEQFQPDRLAVLGERIAEETSKILWVLDCYA